MRPFYVCVEILKCACERVSSMALERERESGPCLRNNFGTTDTCDKRLQDFYVHVDFEAAVFSEGSRACSEFQSAFMSVCLKWKQVK